MLFKEKMLNTNTNVFIFVLFCSVSNLAYATAPTLSSTTPLLGSKYVWDVDVNTNIVLDFSEVVDVESGNITIKKYSDDSTIEAISLPSAQVTVTGTTQITINPSVTLPSHPATASPGFYDANIYVNVHADAFDDVDDNSYAGITSKTTINFRPVDTSCPDHTATNVTFSASCYIAHGFDYSPSITGGTVTIDAGASIYTSTGYPFELGRTGDLINRGTLESGNSGVHIDSDLNLAILLLVWGLGTRY